MSRRLCIAWIGLAVVGFLIPIASGAADQPAVKRIDTEQFDKMRHDKDAVVLDVRTKQEFEQGHVPGATNIDISSPQFRKQIGELDKSKTYLVHCASGVRSDRATRMMSAMGFLKLFDFHGGFKAWKLAQKPIETGPREDAPSK